MSRRSLVQLAVLGLVLGLALGAAIYLPRRRIPLGRPPEQPGPVPVGGRPRRGARPVNVEPTAAPGRAEVLTARVLRSITLPLVVAVVGAVLMVAIAAVIAGSLGSP